MISYIVTILYKKNRYTEQYNNVDKLTAISSDNYGNIDNFPEYQQFLSYIHKNNLDDHPSAIKVQSIDKEMFETYIGMSERAADLGQRAWNDHLRKTYEGYGIYLKTGRFPQNQDHSHVFIFKKGPLRSSVGSELV